MRSGFFSESLKIRRIVDIVETVSTIPQFLFRSAQMVLDDIISTFGHISLAYIVRQSESSILRMLILVSRLLIVENQETTDLSPETEQWPNGRFLDRCSRLQNPLWIRSRFHRIWCANRCEIVINDNEMKSKCLISIKTSL